MAERAAEGEDAEAEDVPMVESIENLEDTRGRPVREHIMAVSKVDQWVLLIQIFKCSVGQTLTVHLIGLTLLATSEDMYVVKST